MYKLLIGYLFLSKWDDDLIWCPSQCYYNFKFNKKNYTIYLRWRWDDPWGAQLIDKENDNWIWLNIGYVISDDLKIAKRRAIFKTIKYFIQNIPSTKKSLQNESKKY